MRQLKFRAWDTETREMSYDFLSKNWLKVCIESPYVELMQFTGLIDRNGNPIYEGDIILIYGEQELDYGFSFEWNDHAIVRWNDEECGFHLDVTRKREVILDEDACFIVDTFPLRKWAEGEWGIEYEVTSNIYEHPELLETK